MDIDELELGARAHCVLKAARIDTVEDLCLFTGQQLMHLGNFGKKCLDEVRRALEEHSLSLHDGLADPRLMLRFGPVKARFNLGLSVARQDRESLARYSVRELFEISKRLERVLPRLEDQRMRIQLLSAISLVATLRHVHETVLLGDDAQVPKTRA